MAADQCKKLNTNGKYQIYVSENVNPTIKMKTAYKCFLKLKTSQNNYKFLTMLVEEYNIMKKLNHENVTKVFDIMIVQENELPNIMIQMEQAQQNLSECIKINCSFKQRSKMLYQVACGMNYLHEKNIAHNDIKSDNILIFYIEDVPIIAKIADFGYARFQSTIHSINDQYLFWKNRNTINLSPEIKMLINQQAQIECPIDEIKADIYSYGLMLVFAFFLMEDLEEFNQKGEDEIYDYIQLNNQNNVPKTCIHHLKDLINKCTTQQPSDRLSAQQIVNHPFFAEC